MKIDFKKTLIVIDGSSFLYRAYYGLKPLHTAQGMPVQAVYGFCKMIKKLIDTFNPEFMILVWDSKGKTVRHELYPEYKSTRQEPPSDLFEQKDLIIEFAKTIGLCQFSQTGVEADDLMYSLGFWWKKEMKKVLLITSDKDMGQMLDEDVVMYDSFKDIFTDKPLFQEKMGFSVQKIPFYFALLGDSSDNIPGVKGIGKLRALELVKRFDSLEDLYKKIDSITQKTIYKNLLSYKADAFLSQKLFTLQKYNITFNKSDVAFNAENWAKANSFFEKLEFKSLIQKRPLQTSLFEQVSTDSVLNKGYNFKLVTTQKDLHEVISIMQAAKIFAYDTECDGLNPLQMKMLGISLCAQIGTAYYIPCGHKTDEQQLSLHEVVDELKPLFENENIKKIAHNAKFDKHVLMNHGIYEKGLFFDTMIASSLVKEEWQKNGLKELSEYHFNETMLTFEQIVTQNKLKNFSEVSLIKAVNYAAADAHQTFKLYFALEKMLNEKNVNELFYKIEMPLIEVLFEMERKGIFCDASVLFSLTKEVDSQLKKLEEMIKAFVEPEKTINLNSPRQIADLLFIDLKLTPQGKSSKGSWLSTNYNVLKNLAKVHPVPLYLIKYRELYKLKTTYIEALPTYINHKTNRIHTSYSQIRVATGRLSSSDPNLQNIPIDSFGASIRAAFKPEQEYLFLSADYSQIELRVLAQLSQDKNLIKLFNQGHDIHAETAAGLLNRNINTITDQDRALGKRINFSILYGLTPYGLSKDLDIPLKDAKNYIDAYFNHYPEVKVWMNNTIEETKKTGYVQTVFGRRRPIPGIYEKNKNLYEEACRIAINTPVQGTAAELMKLGMLHVDNEIKKQKYDAAILLQIHDELLLSITESEAEKIQAMVEKKMSEIVNWSIDLKVNSKLGKNWQEV